MPSGIGIIGPPALIAVAFENGFRLFRIEFGGLTEVVREGLLDGLFVIRLAGLGSRLLRGPSPFCSIQGSNRRLSATPWCLNGDAE